MASTNFIFRAPIKLSKTGELREEYESQLRKRRLSFLCTQTLTHPVQLSFPLSQASLLLVSTHRVGGKLPPEACADMQPLEPGQRSGCGSHRPGQVLRGEKRPNLREEKLQEEKTSEDLIHKFILDDMDIGKRKMEEQQKKDDSVVLKGNQDCFLERLSDSENEEPFQGKQTHRSAFVSRTSAYSFAFLSGNLTSKVERSRSCNDTIQERSKSRQRSAPATKAKVQAACGNRLLNLNRSLQKPTTYEASPRILKKWEQIFQERQIKKTLSKATLTSLASEPGEDVAVPDITNASSCTKEQPQAQEDHLAPDTTAEPRPELDFLPSVSEVRLGRGTEKNGGSQASAADDGAAEPDVRSNVTSLNTRVAEAPDLKVNTFTDKSCLSLGPKALSRRLVGIGASLPDGSALAAPLKGKKQLKYLNNSELMNVQNSVCGSVEKLLGEQAPLLRRGRKRRCKTKHLEHNGSVKRLRHAAPAEAALPPEGRDSVEQKLQQEEEDRRLALHLQRIFDSENRTVERRRVRVDRYLLRSKSTLGAK
ncbi:hypothetical protein EK904_014259 [Melospiza melodia maxima]|nr:hypothetical protein EK904_014259 [Melospiza melodia maxima]